MSVIIVLFILAAIAAGAQPVGDGVDLLRQVSEAARSAEGWRAEGTIGDSPLTISKRGPLEMRYLSEGAAGSFNLTVCDGSEIGNAWYSGISASGDTGIGTAFDCNPAALRWDALLDSLKSALLIGKDNVLGCTQVRVEYAAPTRPEVGPVRGYQLSPIDREICVGDSGKLILWERLYFDSYVVSLTKIERDPDFGVNEFKIPPYAVRAKVPLLEGIRELPMSLCSKSSGQSNCPRNPFALVAGNRFGQ